MDPFATLGISPRFEVDSAEIERRYRELQRRFHPDRHVSAPSKERRESLLKAMEINEAYRTLSDEVARAEALLVQAGLAGADPKAADQEFLMEVMELREGLADAKAAQDLERVQNLAADVTTKLEAVRNGLRDAFDRAPDMKDDHASLAMLVSKLKYYHRFLDEANSIEDAAHS